MTDLKESIKNKLGAHLPSLVRTGSSKFGKALLKSQSNSPILSPKLDSPNTKTSPFNSNESITIIDQTTTTKNEINPEATKSEPLLPSLKCKSQNNDLISTAKYLSESPTISPTDLSNSNINIDNNNDSKLDVSIPGRIEYIIIIIIIIMKWLKINIYFLFFIIIRTKYLFNFTFITYKE